jgi:LysR family cyn operon transcriptional activator
MELRHLRYFVRAAELLHFTRAAESLGVSQPTLSLHIQQLEKELGSPLFDRTGGQFRHVRLTQAGKQLLIHAHDALRAVERGKQEIAELNGVMRGSVTLGVNNIFVARLMSRCLPAFSAAHEGVDVVVRRGNQEDLETAILAGTMDLALAWLPAESREIGSETLFSDELVVVVGAGHPLAGAKKVALRELQSLPLALPTVATNIRRLFDAACAKDDLHLRVSLEIDDTPARLSFVEAGHAATVAPRGALVDHERLRIIPLAGTRVTLSAGLFTHRSAHLSSAARRLADAIRAGFQD